MAVATAAVTVGGAMGAVGAVAVREEVSAVRAR